jgi:hypothetical protein
VAFVAVVDELEKEQAFSPAGLHIQVEYAGNGLARSRVAKTLPSPHC